MQTEASNRKAWPGEPGTSLLKAESARRVGIVGGSRKLRENEDSARKKGNSGSIAENRREAKSKGRKERYTHLNEEFQRIARRDKKPASVINAKK